MEREQVKSQSRKKLPLIIILCIAIALCVGIASAAVGYSVGSARQQTEVVYRNTTAQQLSAGEAEMADVVDAVADTVVEMTVQTASSSGITQSAGSGVVITSTGYIITNNHVVDGADVIRVRMRDGTEYAASLVGTDGQTDIAVVKIEAEGLKSAVFGNSDTLRVGQTAIAIGNPLGSLGGTVTSGIISALSREIYVDGTRMTLLQTNAAINPGNSGGGLFSLSGELVGVVNAKSTGDDVEGLGFAVPANTAASVAGELMEKGYVSGRPDTGMTAVEITDEFTLRMNGLTRAGVYVYSVTGAQARDFAVKDYIVSVNGTVVSSISDYNDVVSSSKPGDVLTYAVIRGSEQKTLTLTVQEMRP